MITIIIKKEISGSLINIVFIDQFYVLLVSRIYLPTNKLIVEEVACFFLREFFTVHHLCTLARRIVACKEHHFIITFRHVQDIVKRFPVVEKNTTSRSKDSKHIL